MWTWAWIREPTHHWSGILRSQLLSSACILIDAQGSPILRTNKQIFLTWFPITIKIQPKFLLMAYKAYLTWTRSLSNLLPQSLHSSHTSLKEHTKNILSSGPLQELFQHPVKLQQTCTWLIPLLHSGLYSNVTSSARPFLPRTSRIAPMGLDHLPSITILHSAGTVHKI